MRKRDDALRETLLQNARQMASESGTEAINMRALAQRTGVSTGTVYNYFASKDDILLALTEIYWRETLAQMQGCIGKGTFLQQVGEIYAFLRGKMQDAAGMLMGSLSNVQPAGREKMRTMQQVLRAAIIRRMEADDALRKDIWNVTFSKEAYADFILRNLMLLLRSDAPDIDFFLMIIEKTLYGEKGE